ncbi:hypothetical protein MNBD_NITROSPIRAE01-882 [hydrothermal vent metagenome]|uniref:Uncharacterized protein n=1 Tax=hydrothermal vent metagenome TaxID=652676 RepID=A0A3B1DA97_9ZZZZ
MTGVDRPPISNRSASTDADKGNISQVSDVESIKRALKQLKTSLAQKKIQKIEEETISCDSGSALRTIDDNDTPLDQTDDIISTQYNDCIEISDATTTLRQGKNSLHISRTALTLQISQTFTDLLIRETNTRTGAFTEILREGNITFSISPQDASGCEDQIFYKNLGISYNISTTGRTDTNGEAPVEHEEVVQLNNWTLEVSETHSPAPGCKIVSTDLTLNGGIVKSHLTHPLSQDDYNIGFSNLVMRLNTRSKIIPGFSSRVLGEEVSLSGLVAVRSPCSFGSFTVSTPSADIPFYPSGGRCAIQGRYIVSTSEGLHAIIARPDGRVQIDEGNDGEIEQTFPNCNIAGTCRVETTIF